MGTTLLGLPGVGEQVPFMRISTLTVTSSHIVCIFHILGVEYEISHYPPSADGLRNADIRVVVSAGFRDNLCVRHSAGS